MSTASRRSDSKFDGVESSGAESGSQRLSKRMKQETQQEKEESSVARVIKMEAENSSPKILRALEACAKGLVTRAGAGEP